MGTGAVINNSALAINRSNALTLSNDISGTGTLTKAGAGMTTLTGTNTYSGTTTISAGTLQVGAGGTTGTLGTGAVVVTGGLAINRSNAVTVNNNISGTGTLAQYGNRDDDADGNEYLQRDDDDQRGCVADRQRRHDREPGHRQRHEQRGADHQSVECGELWGRDQRHRHTDPGGNRDDHADGREYV